MTIKFELCIEGENLDDIKEQLIDFLKSTYDELVSPEPRFCDIIIELRKRLCLSIMSIQSATGLTNAAIRNAESGKAVRNSTVEKLVQFYESQGFPITVRPDNVRS